MKLFIASDIHGSAYYCKKLIENFKKSGAEKLVLLGDLLYHGPRNDLPKEYGAKGVIELLDEVKKKILCVRGNCDTEVDQVVLSFPILSKFGFIAIDGYTFYLTHGHHINDIPLEKDSIVLSGHTHIPTANTDNGFLNINPGSVSMPRNNTPHSYIIYENGVFNFYDLETNEIYNTYKLS